MKYTHEVIRHYGDNRPTVRSNHTSLNAATKAYEQEKAYGLYYALDVVELLPKHDFKPLFGCANGCNWKTDEQGKCIWEDVFLNDLVNRQQR